MLLSRTVSDFVAAQDAASGGRTLFVTAAVAATVLAATLGIAVNAAAYPCNPQMIHYNAHGDLSEHDNTPYHDYLDHLDSHDHVCT